MASLVGEFFDQRTVLLAEMEHRKLASEALQESYQKLQLTFGRR